MSYNSLIATAVLDMPLQDDAASTVVVNNAGTDGTLVGGDNTADLSTTGPTTWLPKALQLDGTNDYMQTSTPLASLGESYAVLTWFRADAGVVQTVLDNELFGSSLESGIGFTYGHTNASFRGAAYTETVASGFRAGGANSLTAETWYFGGAYYDGANIRSYVNGNLQAGTAADPRTDGDIRIGANEVFRNFTGRMAGFVASPIADSSELDELYLGPEPTYTSGATLAANGAYDVGTWDAQSNGTITYEWVVVEADGTVVDSGTGATGTATLGATTGLLTLLVRASNDGGYDVGDYATRTSGYGSAGDGYYEVATVQIERLYSSVYPALIRSVY